MDLCQASWRSSSGRKTHFFLLSQLYFQYIKLSLFSCSVVSDSLLPQRPQHPGACSDSCPLSRWCHPSISSSVIPFSSCLQSLLTSGYFLKYKVGSAYSSIFYSVSNFIFSFTFFCRPSFLFLPPSFLSPFPPSFPFLPPSLPFFSIYKPGDFLKTM